MSASIRRLYNHIYAINDENGCWLEQHDQIGEYFLQNFKILYETTAPTFPEGLENLISSVITLEDSEKIIQIPTPEEIGQTVKEMPYLKASGPDGFPGPFYKMYWNIIKDYFILAVQNFLRTGHMLTEWSNTFVALILKCKKATTFKDFHTISLSNVC